MAVFGKFSFKTPFSRFSVGNRVMKSLCAGGYFQSVSLSGFRIGL